MKRFSDYLGKDKLLELIYSLWGNLWYFINKPTLEKENTKTPLMEN